MCSIFYIDGHSFHCFGKLNKHLGKTVPVHKEREGKPSYNECLCCVDVQALVNQTGQRAVSNAVDIYFGNEAEGQEEFQVWSIH